MELPKLYAPVKIKFWSLRNQLGSNYGVVFDVDTEVERTCRRVIAHGGGWKWQIIGFDKISEWDYFADQDKEILDMYGSEIEVIALPR